MNGKINVKKTTHNTIVIRWDSLQSIQLNSGTLVSSPFTLTIDGYLISFLLSIECRQDFIIYVHQNSSRVGRGIVFVSVENNIYGKTNTMQSYFLKEWEDTCAFYHLGSLFKGKLHTLTIDCKIIWLGFVTNIENSNPPVSSSAATTTFSNKVFPDFTIIVEGQEIPAHEAILAHDSLVFLTMFETPMKEMKENKVIIEDIECSTMEIVLKIIYTGNAEDLSDVDIILKVLHAAEKYQISTIKSLCECKLQLLIDDNNVLNLLEMGNKYRALEVCETCIAYIMAIKNEEISMEFRRLSEEMPNISSAAAKVIMDLTFLVPSKHE